MNAKRPTPLLHQRAFTLVEMMVSVAIIGIIAAVGYPAMTEWFESRRVVGAAENTQNMIQYARSEAIKMGQPDTARLNLRVQPGASWCVGISNTASCDCNTANSCQFGLGALQSKTTQSTGFPGVTMSAPGASIDIPIDSRNGAFVGGNNTVEFTGATGKTVRIALSRLGQVKVCSPDGTGGYAAC